MKMIRVIKARGFNEDIAKIWTEASNYIIEDVRSNFPKIDKIQLIEMPDGINTRGKQYVCFKASKKARDFTRFPKSRGMKTIGELYDFVKSRPYQKLIQRDDTFRMGDGPDDDKVWFLWIKIFDSAKDDPVKVAKDWAEFLHIPFDVKPMESDMTDKEFEDETFYFEYYNSDFGEWEDMELTITEEDGKYQWIEGDGAEESDFIFNSPKEAIRDYKKFVKELGNKVKGL